MCVWKHGIGNFFLSLNESILFSWINSYHTRNSCSSGDNLVSLSGRAVRVTAMSLGER